MKRDVANSDIVRAPSQNDAARSPSDNVVVNLAIFFSNGEIHDNVVTGATGGIILAWGANNITISDITFHHNRSYGNNDGFRSSSGFTGMALSNVVIGQGNDFTGNITNIYNLLTAGVTGNYIVCNNVNTFGYVTGVSGCPA